MWACTKLLKSLRKLWGGMSDPQGPGGQQSGRAGPVAGIRTKRTGRKDLVGREWGVLEPFDIVGMDPVKGVLGRVLWPLDGILALAPV